MIMKTMDFDTAWDQIDGDTALRRAYEHCMEVGFENYGKCSGHDAGLAGILGVIAAWEEIRTVEVAEEIKALIVEK
jgi:hypothetical protein